MKTIAWTFFLLGFLVASVSHIFYFQTLHDETTRSKAACETIKILSESNSIAESKQLSVNVFYHERCK